MPGTGYIPPVPGACTDIIPAVAGSPASSYQLRYPVSLVNWSTATTRQELLVTRGADEVDVPAGLELFALDQSNIGLEGWTLDWPRTSPYWALSPDDPYTVVWRERATENLVRGSGQNDAVAWPPIALLTESITWPSTEDPGQFITSHLGQDYAMYDDGIRWLRPRLENIADEGEDPIWVEGRPAEGFAYALSYLREVTKNAVYTSLPDYLGDASVQVVRVYTPHLEYALGSDVSLFAKRLRPRPEVSLDAEGRYAVSGYFFRQLMPSEYAPDGTGKFGVSRLLQPGTEIRVDYNFEIRGALV